MNKKILAIMLSFLMILTLISPILAVSSSSGATIIDLSPDGNNDSTVIDMDNDEDNKLNPTIIDIEGNDEESNKVDLDSEGVIIDLKGNQKSGEDSHQIELPKRDEEKSQIDNNPEDKYNKILPEKEDNSKDTKSLLEEIVNKIKPKTKEASPDPKENKSVKSILEGIVSKFSKKSDNEDKIEDTNERSVSDEENLELSDESVSEPLKADGSRKPLEVVEKDPIEGSNGKFTQIIEFDSNNQDITYKINVSSKQNIKVKLVSKNENIEVDREGNISFKTDAGSYQYQTGGELIPEDTKFVTDQNSKDYTDSEGYKGTLSSYPVKIPGSKTEKTIYASWQSGCPIPGPDPGHGPSSGDTMSIDPEIGLESIVNESSIDITSFNNNTSFNNISPYDGDTSLNGCRLIKKNDIQGSRYECIYECEGKDTIKTRYEGTVTRPEKDTRTYETRYKDKIEITYKESNGLMDEEVGNGWTIGDFEYTTKNSNNYVTGFSYKGIEKLKTNKNVTISNKNLDGETVTRIDNDAFKYKGASQNADILMENVIIPNEINSIGKNAFRGQNRLKTVVANGVGKSISLEQGFKDNAFYGCSSLTDVTMDELLVVGTSAFEGCSSLVNLKADKVQYVSGGAFTNCQSIEKLNFPNLKTLGQEPFAGCIHFTEITLKDDFRVQSGDINQTFRTSSGNSPNKKKVLIKTLNRENPNNYPIEDENYKMLVRPDKPIDATGTNGGIKWTLYKDGELLFEPVDGVSGTFDNTNSKNIIGERLRHPRLLRDNMLSQKVKKITSYGEINFNEDMHSSFVGFKNLENAEALENWKTDNLKDAFAMFSGCSGLTSLGDLSNWNMSNATNTSYMFSGCSNLTTLDLSKWDMGNATNTSYMFYYCSNLTSLGDLSNWNMSNNTNTSHMFHSCSKLVSLGDLSNWNMSNVTTTSSMFYGCSNLTTLDLSNWNMSNNTNTSHMFHSCSKLVSLGDLSNWNMSNVTTTSSMFYYCSNLTSLGNLSGWIMPKNEDTSFMLQGCSKLVSLGDLSNWNMGNVTNTWAMFYGCSSLTNLGDLSGWTMLNNINTSHMFQGCSNLTRLGDLSNWIMSNVIDTSAMFYDCSNLTSLDGLSNWDMSNATTIRAMFYNCSKLIDITFMNNWNLNNVKNARHENAKSMFDKDINLQKLQFGPNIRLPRLTSIPVLTGEHDGKVYSGHWVNSEDSSEYYTPEEFMTAWHEQEGKPNNTMAGKIYIAKERTYEDTDLGSDWTVGDFIYSKSSLGDIVPDGNFVVGFSESGLKKIETNKNLVLPHINIKGEKVDTVGAGAFYDYGIESIKVPTNIETVENSSFARNNISILNDSSIKYIVNSKDIVSYSFTNKNNKNIYMDSDRGAFRGNNNLTEVNLESLETNNGSSFKECANLTKFTANKLVSTEGGLLFYGDEKLKLVETKSLKKISGSYNFSTSKSGIFNGVFFNVKLPELDSILVSDYIEMDDSDSVLFKETIMQPSRLIINTETGTLKSNARPYTEKYVINPGYVKVKLMDQYGNAINKDVYTNTKNILKMSKMGVFNPNYKIIADLDDNKSDYILFPIHKEEIEKLIVEFDRDKDEYILNNKDKMKYEVIDGKYSIPYKPDIKDGDIMTITLENPNNLPMTGGRTLLIITVMGISMLGLGIKFRK